MPAAAVTPARGPGLLISITELAALLGRSVDSLRQMAKKGRLPAPAEGGGGHGRRQYWVRAEVRRWVESGMPDRATWEAMGHATAKRKR
jgi:excisionase family DNA binding protein